jgi:hypothetical protein
MGVFEVRRVKWANYFYFCPEMFQQVIRSLLRAGGELFQRTENQVSVGLAIVIAFVNHIVGVFVSFGKCEPNEYIIYS